MEQNISTLVTSTPNFLMSLLMSAALNRGEPDEHESHPYNFQESSGLGFVCTLLWDSRARDKEKRFNSCFILDSSFYQNNTDDESLPGTPFPDPNSLYATVQQPPYLYLSSTNKSSIKFLDHPLTMSRSRNTFHSQIVFDHLTSTRDVGC